MNLNKIFGCSILSMSSCVPVSYDSVVWRRQKITQEEWTGFEIWPGLRDVKANAFNSRNKGPWQIVATVQSKHKRKVFLDSVRLSLNGEELQKLEIDRYIQLSFQEASGDWRGWYISNDIMIPAQQDSQLDVEIEVIIDDVNRYDVKAKFRSFKIEGDHVINVLTM